MPRFPNRVSQRLLCFVAIPLATTLLIVSGCQRTPIVQTLSEAEQMTFVDSLLTAAQNRDVNAWNAMLDWQRFADIASSGEIPAELNLKQSRTEFAKSLVDYPTRKPAVSFPNGILEKLDAGSSFKFLRLGFLENESVAIFRSIDANEHVVNYYHYFLHRSKDGRVRAKDIFVFDAGERISEAIRRVWLDSADSKTDFSDVRGINFEVASDEMLRLVDQEQFIKALEFYRELPDRLRQNKYLLITRVVAAQRATPDGNESLIDDYRKRYPQDGHLDYLLCGAYFKNHDFENSLRCIDRTIERLGEDGWLLSIRASVLAELSRYDEARDLANEAIELEPELMVTHFSAINVSLKEKNFDDTAKCLTRFEESTGSRFEDLTIEPQYADFVLTPQYAKWLESRK